MPPSSNKKRAAPSSNDTPPAKRRAASTKTGKQTLFDALDEPKSAKSTPQETQAYLEKLQDSDGSSLSEVDSDEFEDVPVAKRRNTADPGKQKEESEGEEDEMDWEDAIGSEPVQPSRDITDDDIGDLNISLNEDQSTVLAGKDLAASALRKGPSKRERAVRNGTHCIHVQSLMWHNTIRNSWLNDKELQQILVDGLGQGVKDEVDRWRVDMGLPKQYAIEKPGKKGRGKNSSAKKRKSETRDGRDWGVDADRLDKDAINMSRGDPLLRLLKILTAYWRKRFTVNVPGIRKQGYMPLKRLTDEMKSWKKDKSDTERHGERIESVQDLRKLAKNCEGSRDVGAQLFTALLRGLGLETRLVANLQPAGIGWGKNEEALPAKKSGKLMGEKGEAHDDSDEETPKIKKKKNNSKPAIKPGKEKKPGPALKLKAALTPNMTRKSDRSTKAEVINLDEEDSELSDTPIDLDDDASVVEVSPTQSKKSRKKYDRDLHFPHYWSEIQSPVSNVFIAVDAVVLSTVATNGELLATFEPRGKAADQAKQVMAYTVAHSADGSAKDVTVRYLKKHQMPGRTKGYRMPVEKIKVYNKRGKVRKYEDYDWFKTVMSSYERPQKKRTAADDLEDSTDLKPFKPADEKPKLEAESLQWYKQSAEFVLERHLRREEAILPTAKPVKTFTAGKGDKLTEEPVYRRADVVQCKTAESWHKEGREVNGGEQAMKLVNMRAVTTIRKREIEEIERETGEKAKQGLYSRDQTDWIVPPPIGPDREIPRNAFGNIDVYVPSMVPAGAIHIPLKGTARVCRDLNISHAEACTGFEFGKRMAIPILTGVVVAEENEHAVIDAWEVREAERRRKEDIKKQAAALHLWRKFLMGMRIVERMKAEYADAGGKDEELNPFVNKEKRAKDVKKDLHAAEEDRTPAKAKAEPGDDDDEVMAGGGFFMPGEEGDDEPSALSNAGSTVNEKEEEDLAGGFLLEDHDHDHDHKQGSDINKAVNSTPVTPVSLQSLNAKAKSRGMNTIDGGSPSEAEDVKPAKTRTKAPSKRKAVTVSHKKQSAVGSVQQRGKKAKKPLSDEEESESLSDPSNHDAKSDDESSDSPPSPRRVSPEVRITPRKARRSSGRLSSTTKAKSVKSPYFDSEDSELEDSDSDDDEEVIKPRKTTARTRGKAKSG